MSTLFQLDTAKSARKAELEKIISAGLQTFRTVGEALAEVRAAKLYADEFETFEEYAKTKWQIGRSRAFQLMDAASIARNVSTVVEIPNERVARELSKAEPKQRIRVAKIIVKAAPKALTAKIARAAVEQVKAAPRGGLAAMAAAVKSSETGIPVSHEMGLNLKPNMSAISKAQAYAMVDEWWQANWRSLSASPAASPETMVRRILALFK
jgi:hypothetical protein